MNFFSGKSVLIISTESWDHIPVSKHHYSIELARAGAQVYFLNPPVASGEFSIQRIDPNLAVISYQTIRGINRLPSFFRNFINQRFIRRIERLSQTSFDVVWTFDPYRFQNLSLFNAKVSIYHAVDIHYAPHEKEVANSADLIISVADLILNKFQFAKATRVKVNHGLRSHFLNQDLPSETRVIRTIGYVGNLDNFCIDIPTLLKIVEDNKNVVFHFIGPYKDGSPLATQLMKYDHCRLFGKLPSEDLPEYFKAIDIFMMVYDGSNKEVNSNHHKILEFLATGKPTIINFTDEYKTQREIVIMSERNDELPSLVKLVLGNPAPWFADNLVQQRMEFARLNSYRGHMETISRLVNEIAINAKS